MSTEHFSYSDRLEPVGVSLLQPVPAVLVTLLLLNSPVFSVRWDGKRTMTQKKSTVNVQGCDASKPQNAEQTITGIDSKLHQTPSKGLV